MVSSEDLFNENLTKLHKNIFKLERLTDSQKEKIYRYFETLLKINQNMNLTAITEANEIVVKHIEDSLTVLDILQNREIFPELENEDGKGLQILDLGTGAGIPGVILAIVLEEAEFILVDALNKRIKFLQKIKEELKLNNIELIHARAEDLARDYKYRDNISVIVSRAVAAMPTLIEYSLPLAKVGGKLLAMKSQHEDLKEAKSALYLLKGEIKEKYDIILSDSSPRVIYVIEKIGKTSKNFPRKNGLAKQKPL